MELCGVEFKDISTEEWREYDYGNGVTIRIENPKWLHVKKQSESAHSHRLIDADGVSWYLASGFKAIKWKSPTGQEFVVI